MGNNDNNGSRMNAADFVSRLDGVRATGPNRWIAKCCAHDDRSPSLAIAEGDDGRVLCHCFSGCSVEEIVGAIGLTLSDLMPERAPLMPAKRMRFNPMDVLKAMSFQATVVALAASDLANGKQLSAAERHKLHAIAGEFDEAIQMVRGG
jgi:hypothetical protein